MISKRIQCPKDERCIQPVYEKTLHEGSVKDDFVLSCIKGEKTLVKKFINENYPINEKDINGDSPLHYCAEYGILKIMRIIIKKGEANINSQNHFQYTPLIRAVVNNNNQIVSLLIKSNAQLNLQDINGFTGKIIFNFNKLFNN